MAKQIFRPAAVIVLLSLCAVSGCATRTQKIEQRKQERVAAYAGLAPETKSLIDEGRIEVGMPMDAVYIAWGKPGQVVESQSPNGTPVTTWLYRSTTMVPYTYWRFRPYYSGPYTFPEPYLEHDFYPVGYVAAEVNFENGIVKSWRNLPRPVPY